MRMPHLNRVQALQMERVTTVCKAPKNGVVADVDGWNQDRPTTGYTPEALSRRFEGMSVVSNIARKSKKDLYIHQK